MRRILFICFYLFESILFSQNITYQKYTYPNGQISSEGFLKDEELNGIWKSYHINGSLKSIGKWENNKLDSLWLFYDENKHLIREINYRNGKKNGLDVEYEIRKDGVQIKRKTIYIHNLKENLEFIYSDSLLIQVNRYEHNVLNSNSILFKNGNPYQVQTYNNGKLIDAFIVNQLNDNNQKNGKWIELNKRYIITKVETYQNGLLDGEVSVFNQNGIIETIDYYKNGFKNEIRKELLLKEEFSEDSILIFSGYYYDSIPIGYHKFFGNDTIYCKIYDEKGDITGEGKIDNQDYKYGEWIEYDVENNLFSKGIYVDNLKQGKWSYYFKNGDLEQVGTYLKNLKNGIWIWYFQNGAIRRSEKFLNGKRNGSIKEYSEEGSLRVDGMYENDLKNGHWIIKYGDITEKGYFYDDLKNGQWVSLDQNDLIIFKGDFIFDQKDGKHVYYFSNGNVKQEEYFESGVKEGIWKEYDKDGQLIFTREYRNDELFKINGSKVEQTDE